jgi:hypothetical protein
MQSIPCGNESCNPQSLGSLLDDVLVRCAEWALFPAAADDAERKQAIMAAYESGEITSRQCSMLIARFGLKHA